MKKVLSVVLLLMFASIVACQKTTTSTKTPTTTQTGTGNAVDAVGNDLNNVDRINKDLNPDQLNDLDSGLSDVQNI